MQFNNEEGIGAQIRAMLMTVLTEGSDIYGDFLSVEYGEFFQVYTIHDRGALVWEVSSKELTDEQISYLHSKGFQLHEDYGDDYDKLVVIDEDYQRLDEIVETTIEIFTNFLNIKSASLNDRLRYTLYLPSRDGLYEDLTLEEYEEKIKEKKRQRIESLNEKTKEPEKIERLKDLIEVSLRLNRKDIGQYLGLTGDALLKQLVKWAKLFGFKLDGEDVVFEGGRKDDFIAELEKEYESWGKGSKV